MTRDATPFELEGMVSTVTVLRLATPDLNAIKRGLRAKLEQLPGFFLDAPLVIDLSALEGTDEEPVDDPIEIPLEMIAGMLRELKVVPVGVRNLREVRRGEARAAGIGVIHGGKRPARAAPKGTAPTEDKRVETTHGALILRTPLRSGKLVYAEQCDAVVLAPVNAGAEIIADGNIHVYSSLRGRALAGAHGNEEARIFCRSLEADLVAIAGCYLRADEIPEKNRGKPAQIYLENGQLVVAEI
ncbi:MAG TPA: septum site-determining protein MinC [Polyangiales bacterium]|nr:septum site-determining protein MinC [Polyangiales bacterium]